jgi:response regulator RpfG family c-di-GMP phosphodiesterase
MLNQAKKYIVTESEEEIILILEDNANTIENDIKKVEALTDVLVNTVVKNIDFQKLKNIQKEKLNENLQDELLDIIKIFNSESGWVAFNSEIVKNGNVISFLKNGDKYVRNENYNPNEYDWWHTNIQYLSKWWPPYYWEPWDSEIVTYSKKIEFNNKVVALVGSELYLNELEEKIKELEFYDVGQIALIDKDYNTIISNNNYIPDKKEILIKLDTFHSDDTIKIVKDKKYIKGFNKLSNGWIMVAKVPYKNVYRYIYVVQNEVIRISVIVLLISIIVSLFLGHSVASPISKLIDILDDVKDTGNLSQKIDFKGNKELNKLSNTFNQMMNSLNNTTNELKNANEEIKRVNHLVIASTASLAEKRDTETGYHLKRTQEYIKVLAIQLKKTNHYPNITDEYINLLYYCSVTHDIGKVAIPDSILLKPGKLTKEEFEVIKKHTIYGKEALELEEEKLNDNEYINLSREIAHYHHEKWDGTGYPVGLVGDEIPISCRLMALVDVYDALTTKRIYKPAFSYEKAKQILIESKGKHFDPIIVDAFLEVEPEFIKIAERYKE